MANSNRTTGVGGDAEFSDDDLDSVSELQTITDLVDLDDLAARLPGGWTVTADIVQFEDEGLEETLLIRRGTDDPQLVLKPAEMADPAGEIEFYVRQSATDARRHRLTAESLDEACRAAINWVHQRTA